MAYRQENVPGRGHGLVTAQGESTPDTSQGRQEAGRGQEEEVKSQRLPAGPILQGLVSLCERFCIVLCEMGELLGDFERAGMSSDLGFQGSLWLL